MRDRTIVRIVAGAALLAASCSHAHRMEHAAEDDESVYPTPRVIRYGERDLSLTKGGAVVLWGSRPPAAVALGIDMLNEEALLLANRTFPTASSTNACADYPTIVSVGTPESNELNHLLLDNHALTGRLRDMGEEGYLIRVFSHDGKSVIAIAGNTPRGTFYGIMTFLQLMKARGGDLTVNAVSVDDYPAFKMRIFADGAKDISSLRRLARYKINVAGIHYPKIKNWRAPDEAYRKLARETCAFARESGVIDVMQYVNCYHGAFSLGEGRSKGVFIDLSNEAEIERLTESFRIALREGAKSVMLCVDDFCWWDYFTDRERTKFGNIAEAQAWLVNEVYRRLRKDYPACGFFFCPVGPTDGYAGNPTAENAQGIMLRALRERIPKDVPIVWTGPTVRSREISREELESWTAVVGRKPFLWDNTIYSYDEYFTTQNLWNGYRTAGFPKELYRYLDSEGIHVNTGVTERSMASLLTISDYLWNPEAYDQERSTERALRVLYGRELSALLTEFKRRYIDLFALRFYVEDRCYPADREAWDRLSNDFRAIFQEIDRTCGNRALVEELKVVADEFDRCHRTIFERGDRILAQAAALWGKETLDGALAAHRREGPVVRWRGTGVLSLADLKKYLIAAVGPGEELEKLFLQGRREAVVIAYVTEGTNGWRAGLKAGDDIVAYDRHPIQDIEHLSFDILEGARRSGPIPLVAIREGKEVPLEVEPGPLGVVIRTRRSIPVAR